MDKKISLLDKKSAVLINENVYNTFIYFDKDVEEAIKDFGFYLNWYFENYLLLLEFEDNLNKTELLDRFKFVMKKYKEIFGGYEDIRI